MVRPCLPTATTTTTTTTTMTILERIENFQKCRKFADVAVELEDGTVVHCHKVHLALHSVYLKLLFQYDAVAKLCMPAEQFRLIFEWAYRSRLPDRCDTLDGVLHADFLGADDLLRQHLADRFFRREPGGLGPVFQLSHLRSQLLPRVVDHLVANFEEATTANIADFCLLSFDVLRSVLTSDDLFVSAEDRLWTVMKQWILQDLPGRGRHLAALVPLLKLGLMPRSQFARVRGEVAGVLARLDADLTSSCHEAVRRVFDVAEQVQEWKQSALPEFAIVGGSSPAVDILFTDLFMVVPRMPPSMALVTGGWFQQQPSSDMSLYDPWNDIWYRLPVRLPGGRAYHDCVAVDGKLYLVGGFAGEERFKSAMCLDLDTLAWSEVPPLHRERCFTSLVATDDGLLCCMGGFDGASDAERLSSTELFDPGTNQWTESADLTEPRSDAAAVTLDGKVYLFGGFNGNNYLDSAEVLDTRTTGACWTRMAPMNERRGGVGGVAFRNKVYALGGCNGSERLRSVECFDPADPGAGWTPCPPMLKGRSNFGVCAVGDWIVVSGGYVEPSTTDLCETFDGFRWTSGDFMPKRMSAFKLTAIDMTTSLSRSIQGARKSALAYKRNKRALALAQGEGRNAVARELENGGQMFDPDDHIV